MVKAKYGNNKCTVMGHTFESKMEADYYLYLLEEQRKGKVLEFSLQPKINLQPQFRLAGKMVRPIMYTPDFKVKYSTGLEEYIDVKGMSTQQGELKRKMYQYQYEREGGIPLIWVTQSKKYSTTGWIDYFELKRIRRKNRTIIVSKDSSVWG